MTYTLNGATGFLTIDPTSGQILTLRSLDRETTAQYVVTVTATDASSRVGIVSVIVNVDDDNDNSPTFSSPSMTASIPECGTGAGISAYAASACLVSNISLTPILSVTDLDQRGTPNSQIVYSLAPGTQNFAVNATNGRLSVTSGTGLNREAAATVSINLVASDQGAVPLSSTATIDVTLIDVNDNAPVIQASSASVPENALVGTVVLTLNASDADTGFNGQFDFSYVSGGGSPTSAFSVSASGAITITQSLDFETTSQYSLVVRATDRARSPDSPMSSTQTITITVTDVNDNYPIFNPLVYNASVLEGTTNAFVTFTAATDADPGALGVRYQILPVTVGYNLFVINNATGNIFTAPGANFDYETGPRSYTLLVTAFDSGVPQLQAVQPATVYVSIADANDNAPIFERSGYTGSVSEGNISAAAPAIITQVRALDADAPGTPNSQVVYSLRNNDPRFVIDSNTGVISVSGVIDREAMPSTSFLAVASDLGTPTRSNTVLINVTILDVNDNAPVINNGPFLYRITEGDSNMLLGAVNATDADALPNGAFNFRFVGNNPQTFNVTVLPSSGLILLQTPIDRELLPNSNVTSVLSLQIEAFDFGIPSLVSAPAWLNITVTDINDNPPIFSRASYTGSVYENRGSPTVVATVQATDADIGNNSMIDYSILPTSPDAAFFAVAANGDITAIAPFDRETKDTYRFTVMAKDRGVPPFNATATVTITVLDVNDNVPVFNQSFVNVSVLENTAAPVLLATVYASDIDLAENGTVRYYLASGDAALFQVDPVSGTINLLAALDYETVHQYVFAVQAQDQGLVTVLVRNITVTLNVIDVNDNTPQFLQAAYNASVYENIAVGSTILGTIRATDTDSGLNGQVVYSILTADARFAINSSSGVVRCASRLTFVLNNNVVVLTIEARDRGNPSLFTTVFLEVTILDSNDNAPQFTGLPYQAAVIKRVVTGLSVFNVSATDADEPGTPQSTVRFAITGGNNGGYFSIDPVAGTIVTVLSLCSLVADTLILQVTAYDLGAPSLNTTASLPIALLTVNEFNPAFTRPYVIRALPEDIAYNTMFESVTALDSDCGVAGIIRYAITGGNDPPLFYIDPVSGNISARSPFVNGTQVTRFSVNGKNVYDLTIAASDQGVPPRVSTIPMTVSITDVNDNAPVFSQRVYSAVLDESPDANLFVVQLVATDSDTGDNARLNYFIDNTTVPFAVNLTSGAIVTTTPLCSSVNPSFSFNVTVSDLGFPSLSDKAVVNVRINEVNRYSPVFTAALSAAVSILENLPGGTLVTTVAATDADCLATPRIRFSILSGDSIPPYFTIDAVQGAITLARPLDREAIASFSLAVSASDGSRSTTIAIAVTVLDVNDNAPQYVQAPYSYTVDETLPVGSPLIPSPRATDADIGLNAQVSYNISTVGAPFAIDSSNGTITSTAVLCSAVAPQYSFTVLAFDAGNPSLYTPTSVIVRVRKVNNYQPVFSAAVYGFTILENATAGSTVGSINATDQDCGDTALLRYAILSGDDATNPYFTLDAVTGVLSVRRAIDYETVTSFSLAVTATDGSLVSRGTININITDLNDNPPVFSQLTYSFSIDETAPNFTRLGSVSATDRDSGIFKVIAFSLGEPVNGPFVINSTTGDIRVVGALCWALVPQYVLTVVASDGGTPPLQANAPAIINVNRINAQTPVFNSSLYTGLVSEGTSGLNVMVAQVAATDGDCGDATQLRYSIVGGDDTPSSFRIDGLTGEIFVSLPLDRERKASYDLIVRVTDGGRSSTSTVRVTVDDINDNAPVFSQPSGYSASIPETAPIGRSVLNVSATDADIGINRVLRFNISSSSTPGLPFAIDEVTGEITAAGTYCQNITGSYTFTVTAYDQGTPSLSTAVSVTVSVLNVNNFAPVFGAPLYNASVLESAPTFAFIVGVNATDGDCRDTEFLRYSIVSGDAVADPYFLINAATGELFLRRQVDFEQTTSYLLVVSVSDGSLSTTSRVAITVVDVNDNAPVFSPTTYSAVIPETAARNTSVLVVTASDRDTGAGGQIRFAIVNPGPAVPFTVDAVSGVVRADGVFCAGLQSTYTFSVYAIDQGTPQLNSTALITVTVTYVNNYDPVFSQPVYVAHVLEDRPPLLTTVVAVNATDADCADTSKINFGLTTFGGSNSTVFAIFSNGSVMLMAPVDRETLGLYQLQLLASDGGRTGYAALQVIIDDVNDNAPQFIRPSYAVSVSEGANVGTFLLSVAATDLDTGLNALVSYSLTCGNTNNAFFINATNGAIEVAAALDREQISTYSICVTATDGGTPSLSSNVTLTVTVLDINDNNPVFQQAGGYNFSVDENSPAGVVIGSVMATDADVGVNAQLNYSIDPLSNPNQLFALDTVSAAPAILIVTNTSATKVLDFETLRLYTITVVASDRGVPQLQGRVAVQINILDVNDNSPVMNPANVSVAENLINASLLQLTATDRNTGVNAEIAFRLLSNNDSFWIDSTNMLRTLVGLDYETQQVYNVTVEAYNPNNPLMSTSVVIVVTVLDVNDNAPVFGAPAYTAFVRETDSAGSLVVNITATDRDKPGTPGALFNFTIAAGNNLSYFVLDPNTGLLRLNATVNRRLQNLFSLVVVAADFGQPSLSSNVTVTVIVTSVNFGPRFNQTLYNATVPENSLSGTPVLQLTANDTDDGNITLTYSILSGADGRFMIDAATGQLAVNGSLDRETVNVYDVAVLVTDNSLPAPLSGGTIVRVYITDVNDNAPVFDQPDYAFSVSEAAPFGFLIGRFTATDADLGRNALFNFSLTAPNSLFAVTPTGNLTLIGALDRENTSSYTFSVMARDGGVPALNSTVNVTITVTDVNDNTPVFVNLTAYTPILIPRNRLPGVIGKAVATDADIGQNANLTYSLVSASVPGYIAINGTSGDISLNASLCNTTATTIVLLVQAIDAGVPPLLQREIFTVVINNVNQFAPVFSVPAYSASIADNSPAGTYILQVAATDADVACGTTSLTYSLVGDPTGLTFRLDPITGTLTTLRLLSRTEALFFDLFVDANDGQIPPQTTRAPIRVVLNDQFKAQFAIAKTANGFLIGQESASAAVPAGTGTNYQHTFGFFRNLNVGGSGTLQVSWGGLTASRSFTTSARAAFSVSALLQDVEMWYDRPNTRATIWVLDDMLSPRTTATTVVLRLTPDASLTPILSTQTTATCTTSTTSGHCTLQTPDVSYTFFNSTSLNRNINYTFVVDYSISGGSFQPLGNIPLRLPVAVPDTTFTNDIVTILPGRPMVRNQKFTADVYGNLNYATVSFTMSFTTDVNVNLLSFTIDTNKWLTTVSVSGRKTIFIANIKTLSSVPTTPVGKEYLFTINFQVTSTATQDAMASINSTVESASNQQGRVNIRGIVGAVAGTFVDRIGISQAGRLYVQSNILRGLFAHAAQSELVNTAVLNNAAVSSAITTYGCYACPLSADSFQCTSTCTTLTPTSANTTSPSVLSVSASGTVTLSGAETAGSASATVSVYSGNLAASVPFRVWFPQSTVINLEDTTLNAVPNWLSGANCSTPRYRRSRVRVYSTLRADPQTPQVVDVTEVVRTNLQVSSSALTIDNSRFVPYVAGASPGSGTVNIVAGARTVNTSAIVTVTSTPMNVVQLTLMAGSDLTWNTPAASAVFQRTDVVASEANVLLNMNIQNKVASVVGLAVFANGVSMQITSADGLVLNSTDVSVATTGADTVTAGANTGSATIIGSWLSSGSCGVVFGNGSVTVPVQLADPVAVRFVATTRIVSDTDNLYLVGTTPSFTYIQAFLRYPSGQEVEMTNDPRTVWDLRGNASSLFSVVVDGVNRRVVPNTNGLAGIGSIKVNFTHLNNTMVSALSGNLVSITVVKLNAVQIKSTPWPAYTGADTFDETVLSPYGSTGITQSSRMRMTLLASDGATVAADTLANTNYATYSTVTPTSPLNTIVSVTRSQGVYLVTALAVGVVDVEGSFGTMLSTTRVRITVSATPVTVTALSAITFVSTLRGTINTATAQANVDATFSDTTVYTGLFASDGTPQLPGLVNFTTSVPAAATVVADRGTVTLRNNYNTLVVLTAQAIGTAVSRTFSFACNLDPVLGDVDLGNATGIPMGPLILGSRITVPVRVNTGSTAFGAFTLDVRYNNTYLRAVTGTEGSSWSGGIVAFGIDFPPIYNIIAAPNTATQAGTAYHVANMIFDVIGGAGQTVSFTANLVQLVQANVASGVVNIVDPHAVVAGAADARITAGRRRRDIVHGDGNSFSDDIEDASSSTKMAMTEQDLPNMVTVQARAPASLLPPLISQESTTSHQLTINPHDTLVRSRRAACVSGRPETGDTNGDCVFDTVDVTYTLQYVAEALLNFTGTFGPSFVSNPPVAAQLSFMDADLNSVIDSIDALYLSKVLVFRGRIIKNLQVTTTSSANNNGCVLSLQVQVLNKGDSPDTSADGNETTLVFFDLASNVSSFTALFASSNDSCATCKGNLLRTVNHVGVTNKVFGGLVRARRVDVSQGLYAAAFQTNLDYATVRQIGLSVIVVTLDPTLAADPSRIDFIVGPPQATRAFAYNDRVNLAVPVYNTTYNITVPGYSPLLFFNNTVRYDDCQNLYPPVFNQSAYNFTLFENVPNMTLVGTVFATDKDPGLGGVVRYSIVSSTASNFTVNATNGNIYLTGRLDRELFSNVTIVAAASDGVQVTLVNVTLNVLDVNDNVPVFVSTGTGVFVALSNSTPAQYTFTLTGLVAAGSFIGQVFATDLDQGQFGNVTFSFANAASAGAGFTLNSTTGVINIVDFIIRQSNISIYLTVNATDGGGLTTVGLVTVNFVADFDFITYSRQFSQTLGNTTATGGSLSASASYPSVSTSIATARAVLVEGRDGVFVDSNQIRVAIQALDVTGGVPSQSATVFAQVTPATDLLNDLIVANISTAPVSATCTTSVSNLGICVAYITLPTAWFYALSTDRSTSVSFGIQGQAASGQVGPVTLHRTAFWVIPDRDVLVQMPFRSIGPGEIFRASVWAFTTYAVASFQLSLTTTAQLQIDTVELDRTVWTAQVTPGSTPQSFAVNAILLDSLAAPQGIVTTPTRIANIVMRPTSVNSVDVLASLQVTIQQLGSIQESSIRPGGLPTPVPAKFVDRFFTGAVLTSTGSVFLSPVELRGLLPLAATNELVNYARLTGALSQVPLSIVGVFTTAQIAVLTSSLTCATASPAIHVYTNCSAIYFDGTENETTSAVTVQVSATSLVNGGASLFTSSIAVRVWSPRLPILLTLSNTNLKEITGWQYYDASRDLCRLVYQRTLFRAVAMYSWDGLVYRTVDVTSLVGPYLQSSVASVASIRDNMVLGNNTGNTSIILTHHNISVASAALTVAPSGVATVTATGMTLLVASSLQTQVSVSPFYGDEALSTSIVQNFDREDFIGGVMAFATLSDGTRMPLAPRDGLFLSVSRNDEAVIQLPASTDSTFVNSHFVTTGSGTARLQASWLARCDAPNIRSDVLFFPMASSSATVTVVVPDPIGVVVESVLSKLALPNDTAATSLYPTTSPVRVFLLYRFNGSAIIQRKDMTNDPRTLYDSTASGGRISACPGEALTCNPTTSQTVQLNVTSTATAGIANMQIRFSHVSLVANVTIQVVGMQSLAVMINPFPVYSGSSNITITKLSRYNNQFSTTVVRQQGIARLQLTLSDGSLVDVSTFPQTTFYVYQPGTSVISNTVVALDSLSRLISVLATSSDLSSNDLQVDIAATFTSRVATPVRLTVTNDPVFLQQLTNVRLLSQQGLNLTFYVMEGIRGAYTDALVAGGVFSDGSQHPRVVDGTTLLLPGLLAFSSSNPAVIMANSSTGVLTLMDNSIASISITVAVRNSVVQSFVSILSNLQADVGDVDLGFTGQFALPTKTTAAAGFFVPVVVNTGNVPLGAVDIEITYDPLLLTVPTTASGYDIQTGPGWPGGIFIATIDPVGTIKLGGAIDANTAIGTSLQIATIHFVGRTVGSTRLAGTVNTMAQKDLTGTKIGPDTPRAMVAGSIIVSVGSARKRRDVDAVAPSAGAADVEDNEFEYSFERVPANVDEEKEGKETVVDVDADEDVQQEVLFTPEQVAQLSRSADSEQGMQAHQRRRRAAVCISPPCSVCPQARETGDANGDCIFDLNDVTYLQIYLAERSFGFLRPDGILLQATLIPVQLDMMDQDLSGSISVADALYMARVNFNILRFVSSISVRPVQIPESGGLFSVNITAVSKGNLQASNDRTVVLVDFAHSNASFQPLFDSTIVALGRRLTTGPKTGNNSQLYGMIVQAVRSPPLFNFGQSATVPSACLEAKQEGVTCTGTSSSPATRYYHSNGDCLTFTFNGCSGNNNNFATQKDCQNLCIASYKHYVALNTSLVSSAIGISIVMVSFDSAGYTSTARSAFLSDTTSTQFAYPFRFDLTLPVAATVSSPQNQSVNILATLGYSPLLYANNSLASRDAVNSYAPAFVLNVSDLFLPENTNGTDIISAQATDADNSSLTVLSYWFDNAPTAVTVGQYMYLGNLRLNRDTGLVTVIQPYDYEQIHQVNFTIVVSDGAPPSPRQSRLPLRLNIVDRNDNAPIANPRCYGALLGANTKAGFSVVRVLATDADSNTALGGNNKLLSYSLANDYNGFFRIDSSGLLTTTNLTSQRPLGSAYNLTVQINDNGSPRLSTQSPVTVGVVDDDYLVTITTTPGVDSFRALSNSTNASMCNNPCIDFMANLLQAGIVVTEVSASTVSGVTYTTITDVTFYVVDSANGGRVLPASSVVSTLVSLSSQLQLMAGLCSVSKIGEPSDRTKTTTLQHFLDNTCTVTAQAGAQFVPTGYSGSCVEDDSSSRAGRVVCDNTTEILDVRVYDNALCNGAPQQFTNVRDGACVPVIPRGGGAPTYYFLATCTAVVLQNTTPTSSADKSSGFLSTTIIGAFAGGAALILLVLILLVARYRRQKQQLRNARMMVLASQGDVTFGTPEPLHKEPEKSMFAGGEVDPETGEISLYKTTTTVIEGKNLGDYSDARLPSVWGGKRSNPLYAGMPGLAGGKQQQQQQDQRRRGHDDDDDDDDDDTSSVSDVDSLMEELDNLSDFENFEEETRRNKGGKDTIKSRKKKNNGSDDDDDAKDKFGTARRKKGGSFKNPPFLAGGDNASLTELSDTFDDPEFEFDTTGTGLVGGKGGKGKGGPYLDVATDTESESDPEEVVVTWDSGKSRAPIAAAAAAAAAAEPVKTLTRAPKSILRQDPSAAGKKVSFPTFNDETNMDDATDAYDNVSPMGPRHSYSNVTGLPETNDDDDDDDNASPDYERGDGRDGDSFRNRDYQRGDMEDEAVYDNKPLRLQRENSRNKRRSVGFAASAGTKSSDYDNADDNNNNNNNNNDDDAFPPPPPQYASASPGSDTEDPEIDPADEKVAYATYLDADRLTREWQAVEMPEAEEAEMKRIGGAGAAAGPESRVGSHFHAVKSIWGQRSGHQ